MAELHAKARKADRDYNGHTGTGPGPVLRKLVSFGRIFGYVCGAFGEGSPDLHAVCKQIAETAASTRFQDLGALSIKESTNRALRYVYRAMGMEMMRGTAALRYHRLSVVLAKSSSFKAAIARRKWVKTRWLNESQAYFDKFHYGTRAHHHRW